MNSNKMTALCALFLAFAAVSSHAQDYDRGIGLRLGYPTSISYKQFISNQGAVELFLGFRSWNTHGWTNIGGMYQHHNDISELRGLSWYYGGGASVFFWNYKSNFPDNRGAGTSIGILGVVGLDYKFAEAPINLSLDWIPTFFVNGYGSGFGGGYGALSVRYTF